MKLSISVGIARFFGYALLTVFAVVTLGGLVPSIPVLGSIGPLLITPFGPWIVICSGVGAVAVFLRWRKIRNRGTLLLTTLGAFAAIGTGYMQVQQIAVASDNGIAVDLVQTLLPGRAQHMRTPPHILNYASFERQPLPLAIYSPAAAKEQTSLPILVYVHGGGWGAGSLHDRASDMYWFADQGYLVISIEYTLSSKERHTWNVAQPQIGCALIWIADNAARFGGDPSRIALFGESAGGNLVLNVSYRANAGLQPSVCPGTVPRIAATVAAYPIVDALLMYRNDDVLAGRFARQMTTYYTGGTPEQYPERYSAISSATHITSAAPPTLLLPGLADHLLPPQPVYEFAASARAAGIDARVIAVPYAEHSFDQKSGSVGSQLFRGVTLGFLQQYGITP